MAFFEINTNYYLINKKRRSYIVNLILSKNLLIKFFHYYYYYYLSLLLLLFTLLLVFVQQVNMEIHFTLVLNDTIIIALVSKTFSNVDSCLIYFNSIYM